jgi:hypothetical protein
VLTSEDYRQLAERCALLAGECPTPSVVEALRMLALDYLTKAAMPAGPTQQKARRDRSPNSSAVGNDRWSKWDGFIYYRQRTARQEVGTFP